MTMMERQVMRIVRMEDVIDQPMQPGAGNQGLSHRSYGRLYYNARRILENVDYFVDRMAPWAARHVDDSMEHRRIVGRFIMTEYHLSEALRRSDVLRENIEVVIPVGEYNGSPIMMAMWGINNHRERTLDSVHDIERKTDYRSEPNQTPLERVDSLRRQGHRFFDSADSIEMSDILSLWGPIFEWSQQDIDNLQVRLHEQQNLPSKERSVWFTVVMDGAKVVALAMAERLNLPLGNGESLPVVESTEWCVRREWQHRGLGIGAASHVHAQVFEDLEQCARPAIILAETNFTSRADRIGHGAGMVVAAREVASFAVPQVLRQNVAIGDGLCPEELRDFTMMYVPPENVIRYYSQRQRQRILGRGV